MRDLIATNTPLTIHLLPGTYLTAGGQPSYGKPWQLVSNLRILGSGIDSTIIKARDGAANNVYILWNDKTNVVNNVSLCDMTVDVNGQNNSTSWANGVSICGIRSVVHNVKVIHLIGANSKGGESFGIEIRTAQKDGSGADYGAGNTIDGCEVSSVLGDYCSAICGTGTGVTIFNCRVYFPVIRYPAFKGAYMAYNCAWFRSLKVIGNYSEGGNYGFYVDTGTCTNGVIANNIFRDSAYGIAFNDASGVSDIEVANNQIFVTKSGSSFYRGQGLQTYGPTYNLHFHGNTITGGQPAWHVLNLNYLTNAVISDNVWDESLMDVVVNACSNVNTHDNYTIYGQLAKAVRQTNRMQAVDISGPIFINPGAYPMAATTPGGSAIWNDGTNTWGLQSSPGNTRWSRTNKLIGP